jgi:hypothetical protein
MSQYTKILKIPTLQTYFSLQFIKFQAYTKPKNVLIQDSEVLSIIRYRGTSKIAGQLYVHSSPAIFEVRLYLIIDSTSHSCGFKLEVFIWRQVVYVPKSSTTFRGILNSVIFSPRDTQEYIFMLGIRMEITVFHGINCRFNGRKYPFNSSADSSPINSICDHQIYNWCREIFKYNTVIS